MSTSISIYRISKDDFAKLETGGNRNIRWSSIAKDYIILEKSYMGFEYILLKCVNDNDKSIISELFIPKQSIEDRSAKSKKVDETADMYDFDFLENESILYLPPEKIQTLNEVLLTINAALIRKNYNAEEFNRKGIYPEIWNESEKADTAFNARHLIDELDQIKSLIEKATHEQDYLLVFIG